ncbi:MAG: outer membrane beta-barrel protein [Bacteroidales bacterium]|nr:outer membrane beta-barrel protein [Bacteroidales bacterium]
MTKRRILMMLVGLFATLALSAQSHKVTVKLQDAVSGEPVGFATVSLTPEKGSAKYALTDNEGNGIVEKVRDGKYTFKAEIMGYKSYSSQVEVKGATDLGTIKLELDQEVLDAASVSATGNPIIIKKDTVEYNASSFKISDDNMLVDLLKKLPGIEVAEDGSITSNGETITKITIDGKTFFLDDPQLASNNIPAKLIEKVKVVKKKSEQAEFTGIDDGNDETVIDLTVQKGMMNGVFGNLTGGVGHDLPSDSQSIVNDWRYTGNGMIGRFTEDSQISLILNGNNTNNRGFNDLSGNMMGGMMGGGGMMGRGGGGGGFGSGNGINTSWMGGVNGAFDLLDDRMQLGANYLYNGSNVDVLEETYKKTFQTDGSVLLSDTDGTSHRHTDGHRFGMRLEHKFSENTSILLMPQVNFGGGNYVQQSIFETGMNSMDNKVNSGFSNNTGDNKNFTTNGFALFRQRLGIPGRTISLNTTWNYSRNKMDGLNQSLTNTQFDEAGNVLASDLVNQRVDQSTTSRSLGARLSYTEPMGNYFYLEGSYNINWSQSNTDKLVYNSGPGDPNPSMEPISMGYFPTGETYDETYSNTVVNKNLNQNIGVAVMYQNDKLRGQLGTSAMPNRTYNYTNGKEYDDFRWNFAPRAMLFYDFTDNANVRLFYNGRSSQPSTSQLNPVMDNSNPLAMTLGNPYLTPYFSHNIRNEWEYSNKQTFFTARVNFQGGMVQNPITNAVWFENGRQFSFPLNGANTYNANVNIVVNSPIAKSNFSLSNTMRLGYTKTGSYIGQSGLDMSGYFNEKDEFDYEKFHADYFEDHKDWWERDFLANDTRSLSVMENFRATYRNDWVEVILGARTRMNKPWYTVQSAVDATWNNAATASFKWTVGDTGLELSTDGSYRWYEGYTTEQPSRFIWNATISKSIFKRQATIAIRAYDILDQSQNLSVSQSETYYTETRNNTLGRYIVAAFTWRFGTFGGNRRGGFGGPGGFGGGRPPMGGGFRPF